ncbi:EAL domain-containing protein [Rugamonas rubra]|uniref:Diguanylate cyclase (GGDEF) domain-containing protein n=1 Tax=Rugamonas rubra TaxID=758825 RepID=A0A1I4PJY3_9BURK|nr:EAL domain-containing protein [Rugamonas rubra]SFM28068.1 diguanylate cyclase (GGDEF) domain-containing protein [Rugamonas rubra]
MISQSSIFAAKLLIVDDQEINTKLLEHILLRAGYSNVHTELDSRRVVARHQAEQFDLILLDMNMPHMDGFEVLAGLKALNPLGYLPVLVVTAAPDHKLRALNAGARDFVSKPFDRMEVLTRIHNLVEVRLLYKASRDYGEQLAHFDPLTGLPNRSQFRRLLGEALELARSRAAPLDVLMLDLDHFKQINDPLGHACGDELLCQLALRLAACRGERATLGRLGGDEFGLILAGGGDGDDASDAVALAARVRQALRAPFALAGREVNLSVSIGVASFPADADDADTMLRYADTALSRAKEGGRDACCFFTSGMNERAQHRLELETGLRRAIELRQFELHYQPKASVGDGRVGGAEALLRWNRPGHGMVAPAGFIPLLEETGLIVPLGAWIIFTACHQIAAWDRQGLGAVRVAVNVASRQFASGELEAVVANALADSGIDPDLLELELTEGSLMSDAEAAIATMRRLKAGGVRISIDDFGTGYSSLAYLKRFPIDTLKIDIAFIREVTSDAGDAAIVLAIIGMAHSLGLSVVAEGVETAAQLGFLARHHCDYIQGYYFSKPLPAAQFAELLHDQRRMPLPDGMSAPPAPTLLVVDDDADILLSLQRLLRGDGYRVLTAGSAADGFALLAQHPVHLILCDQRMPDMSGNDFLDKAKDMYPDTFRIVLSGHTDIAAIMGAINRGSLYRFYTKPWDNRVLRDNIRAAFRHYWQLHGARFELPAPLPGE